VVLVNQFLAVPKKHAAIKLVRVVVVVVLMMALGLIEKVVEKIVLAKKLSAIVDFELVR
jgi:hypothetical protein